MSPDNFQSYIERLFPICRSLTGNGNRKSLNILSEILPIEIKEISTGTKVYDWVIPKEWNIYDAWIKDPDNEKVLDFQENNLHVVSYSVPINEKLDWNSLKPHLHTHKKLNDAIPYLTSYYKDNWGFLSYENQYNRLRYFKSSGVFEVFIDSNLKSGSLTYGEHIIKGKSKKEILISCYICHPSMANDSLSGVLITAYLAKYIKEKLNNYWTYRVIFVPESIGAIAYANLNEKAMKNIDIGMVITTSGGPGGFGYKQSWDKNCIINKLCEEVFHESNKKFKTYPFDIHGSDERQFSSPGFRINTITITKDKYYEYEEYHSSLDNLDFVNGEQLYESFLIYCRLIDKIERQVIYINKFPMGEVMLSKHNLYNKIGGALIPSKRASNNLDIILWILFLCDGKTTFEEIKNKLKIEQKELDSVCQMLLSKKLLKRYKYEGFINFWRPSKTSVCSKNIS